MADVQLLSYPTESYSFNVGNDSSPVYSHRSPSALLRACSTTNPVIDSDLISPYLCLCVEGPNEMAVLRWNSQHGSVFVDGSHLKVSAL